MKREHQPMAGGTAETKAAKFSRLASARVKRAVNAINLVGALASAQYEKTPAQVDKIENYLKNAAVRAAVARLRCRPHYRNLTLHQGMRPSHVQLCGDAGRLHHLFELDATAPRVRSDVLLGAGDAAIAGGAHLRWWPPRCRGRRRLDRAPKPIHAPGWPLEDML
jgi:hypothetical protein